MTGPVTGNAARADGPRRWSAWVRFAVGVPTPAADEFSDGLKARGGDDRLGFVMTGQKTIDAIVRAVHDGRNVMLVGPRGTGKSHMARLAVEQCANDPDLGVVAVIEIQGDPNKPPSDYFDDGIVFSLEEPPGGPKRVFPHTVKAPFFANAEKAASGYGFQLDADGALVLVKTVGSQTLRVNRVVVFWDEGNRSSPAMQNAMLSLLAEGIIRRDGVGYKFPPVSCVLTRNPDGYDAQSAKLPSPLIDRFGMQMYVYNPDLETFNKEILPKWHERLVGQLQLEVRVALRRLVGVLPAPTPDERDLLVRTADALEGANVRVRNGALLREAYEVIGRVFRDRPEEELARAARHALSALRRALRCPELPPPPATCTLRQDAAYVALLILATWGDAREPAEKPGMQYLPWHMRETLQHLAGRAYDPDGRMGRALKRLGDLTRYGTSIRAYIDILETLVGYAIRRDEHGPELRPAETNRQDLLADLGLLLNHRCELSFNPDREPEKARTKTNELVEIATAILSPKSRERFRPLCAKGSVPPDTDPAGTGCRIRVLGRSGEPIKPGTSGARSRVAGAVSACRRFAAEKLSRAAAWAKKQFHGAARGGTGVPPVARPTPQPITTSAGVITVSHPHPSPPAGLIVITHPPRAVAHTRFGRLRRWAARIAGTRRAWWLQPSCLEQVAKIVGAVAVVTTGSWLIAGLPILNPPASGAVLLLLATEVWMGSSALICRSRADRVLGGVGAVMSAVLVWMVMRGHFWPTG